MKYREMTSRLFRLLHLEVVKALEQDGEEKLQHEKVTAYDVISFYLEALLSIAMPNAEDSKLNDELSLSLHQMLSQSSYCNFAHVAILLMFSSTKVSVSADMQLESVALKFAKQILI